MAQAWSASNVEDALPRLQAPTLVLHPRNYLNIAAERSMEVASRIPNARMSLIEGNNSLGDAASGIAAIRAFLAEVSPFEKQPDAALVSGTGGSLSVREVEVLGLISAGKSNQQIADELVLSIRTVERHINHIYTKIGVHTKAQATAYALGQRLT